MKLVFSRHAWEDYLHWQKTDRQIVRRINALIENIRRAPFKGIGKPEPLKNRLTGYWSRRIDSEHRLVYRIEGESIYIVQARYHY
ncbi:MAG: Txe/YoeB family addiction module toxin [Acidobacteria bacterium]|nr:Txe/YoeB family addiction module toxin [Acidobacteriota bacterium]